MSDELSSREADEPDLPEILELLRRSMGRASDDRFDALFRWKHLESAFGPSPMWVACAGDRIVGLRTFMRWEWQRGVEVVRCVRAVDTATDPAFQGRGIFRRLTLDALPALEADGVQFIFNTPNAQSLPGYLKMGWHTLGRAAVRVRPLSPKGAVAIARSRVPASHWSEPLAAGVDVADVITDPAWPRLIAASQATKDARYRTRRTPAFFEWRYCMPLLHYRAVVSRRGIERGTAIVRVRRRGNARELVIAALLAPDRSARRALMRDVRHAMRAHADYVLGVGDVPGCVRVPKLGPVVTARPVSVAAPTAVSQFDLSLGDIELF